MISKLNFGSAALISFGLWVFAAAFFVIGILRIPEFNAAGLSRRQRNYLIPLHVVGCALFSVALALLAQGPEPRYKLLMARVFAGALFILFPIHIFVNVKRRILISHKSPSKPPRQ